MQPLVPSDFLNSIREKYTNQLPIFLIGDMDSIKLEIKPYLQPFEQILAKRELNSLLEPGIALKEQHGFVVVSTDKSEEFLLQRLTYWQRAGNSNLKPTLQTIYEFTQNGFSKGKERKGLHTNRRLRYGPHDLHEYRGKFFPQLVRSLINIANIPDNGIVLDPMCGSGTAPCEAVASGRNALGVDLNPLSVLISSVKAQVVLEKPDIFYEKITRFLSDLSYERIDLNTIWSTSDLEYLLRWFSTNAIEEIASVIHIINNLPDDSSRDFFKVCLSNIIRSVSWQKETDLRVRKEIKPFDTGIVLNRFQDEVLSQLNRIYPYLCIAYNQNHHPSLHIRLGDATSIDEVFPEFRKKVDLLVTSPPYATALPYLDTDRLSLIALGLLPRKLHKDREASMIGTREVSESQRKTEWNNYQIRKSELPQKIVALIDLISEFNHTDSVGFRRRNLPALLGKYYINMLDAMRSAHRLMKAGARAYYVVGNNSTVVDGNKLEIPTDQFLFDIGEVAGWHKEEIINMELLQSRDIFKENRGSKESILCFRA
jgi:site-specific DNA-methyltransferase (cytosine-N4-specific)